MASTNLNITPEDGLVEGDLFQLLLRPQDADLNDAALSSIAITIRNGGVTITKSLADLSPIVIDSVTYQELSFTVGPGLTQIQGVATGSLQAADLAYIEAEPQKN